MTGFPSTWTRRTLGELGTYINGMAFKPSDWTSDGLPIIRIQNLTDSRKPFNRFAGEFNARHRVRDGDLLISWSASLGAFIWDRGDAILNQHIFRVEVNDEFVEKHFLYYLVLHMLDEMAQHTHGSTMKHITKRKFEALPVAVPPKDVQGRVVGRIEECLERVDEIHALRQKSMNEVRSLEGAVFADFVAEHVKQEKSTPFVRLGEILVRAQYGSSSKANTNGDGVPILRMGNIQSGHLDVSDLKHIRLPAKELEKYRLAEGDILFNRTNSLELVGKAATFTGLGGDWVFASYLIRIEVDRGKAVPEYVTAVINSRIGRSYVYRTARRAIGMVNINAKQIQQLELPLPRRAEQERLVERLREAKAASDSIRNDIDIELIDALPGAILQRAFAGEL